MRKRLVFLGAGHAQLYSLKRTAEFTRRGFEVVAVAPDVFWYSGLATGVLGGGYAPELDQVDVGKLVEAGGGRFLRDRVTGLDLAAGTIRLENAAPLRYDALSITLGSEPPPVPGAEAAPERVYAVKPVRQLWELRLDLERRFAARETPLVSIAGGGVTACELAANVAQLASLHGAAVRVVVLTGGKEVLRQLPRRAASRVVEALEKRRIEFRREARLERIERDRLVLSDGGTMPYDIVVNATGLRPAAIAGRLGLPADRQGAIVVDRHLRSPADPRVHGGGDCVAVAGRELPRIGVYAIRQAPILFHNLLAALQDDAPTAFHPQRRYLWIMNLGDGTGLAARGKLWWHGRAAFWLKDRIDRRFLAEYALQ